VIYNKKVGRNRRVLRTEEQRSNERDEEE